MESEMVVTGAIVDSWVEPAGQPGEGSSPGPPGRPQGRPKDLMIVEAEASLVPDRGWLEDLGENLCHGSPVAAVGRLDARRVLLGHPAPPGPLTSDPIASPAGPGFRGCPLAPPRRSLYKNSMSCRIPRLRPDGSPTLRSRPPVPGPIAGPFGPASGRRAPPWFRPPRDSVFHVTNTSDVRALTVAGRGRVFVEGLRYGGGVGQWSWLAHRLTGLGVLFFLVIHIIDTFLVVAFPAEYDFTVSIYGGTVRRRAITGRSAGSSGSPSWA